MEALSPKARTRPEGPCGKIPAAHAATVEVTAAHLSTAVAEMGPSSPADVSSTPTEVSASAASQASRIGNSAAER